MASRQLLLVVAALVSVLLLLWRPSRTAAAEYPVGGDGNGWDTGTNYATWAQARSFAAGDVLVFNYVKGQHNVYEVTQAAYRSCDATAAGDVLAAYDTGFDRIALPEGNKTYWFICQVPNHCTAGMKLAVNVSSGAGSPTLDAPSAAVRNGWAAWTGLVLLGVAHVLVN